jgi:hypothetical protein
VSVAPDNDGTAKLYGEVQTSHFAGSGAAWFNLSELREFCDALSSYPIRAGSPPALAGGYWGDGGQLKDTHLAVQVVPYDNLGKLQINVQLREPVAMNEPADRVQSVRTWFVAGYNDIDAFRIAFSRVLKGEADEAVLTSTVD